MEKQNESSKMTTESRIEQEIERLNRSGVLPSRLVLTHDEVALDEARVQQHFSSIQKLSDM